MPALQTARKDLVDPLKDGGNGASGSFRGHRLRSALVVSEVALSLVLLTGAGLLMRSFVKLQTVELGLDPTRLRFSGLSFPRGEYGNRECEAAVFSRTVAEAAGAAGSNVGHGRHVPATLGRIQQQHRHRGRPTRSSGTRSSSCAAKVTSKRSASVPRSRVSTSARLLQGRVLSATDVDSARAVGVVNQTFVREYFGDEDPVGRTVRVDRLGSRDGRTAPSALTVIVWRSTNL